MIDHKKDYDLAGQVIGCAMEVHRDLGCGFNEKVYKNALAIELREQGFVIEVEKKITVYYKRQVVGEFAADIVISDTLILEPKAVMDICPAHETQLVNYLKATNTQDGLLLNFGAPSLQFKKKFKEYTPKSSSPPKLQA